MVCPVRLALAMAAGILAASWLAPLIHPLLYVATAFLSLLHLQRPWRGPVISALIGAALLTSSLATQREAEDRNSGQLDDREHEPLLGTIVGPTQLHQGRQQLVLDTGAERIWLTLYEGDDNAKRAFLPGQQISVLARLGRPLGMRGLGAADRKMQVMAQGASLVASASAADVQIRSQRWSPWRPAMRMHAAAVDRVQNQSGTDDGRAIVAALATGERRLMSDSLNAAVRASGLAHLLAVSGMHMAAVVALVYFLCIGLWCLLPWRQSFAPKAVASGVALMAAIAFAALTGARPSTCRALLVAALVLVGIMCDRRVSLLAALAWAALAMLCWRPVLLWDVGFQMSFAATMALAVAFAPQEGPLVFEEATLRKRLVNGVWNIMRASFWASFATMPIALYHFGEVSPWAIVGNVLAVPLVTLILLPVSLVGIILSSIWSPLGSVVLEVCIGLADALAQFCYALESLIPMQTRAPLHRWEFFLWAALGLVLLWKRLSPWSSWRRGSRWAVVAILLAMLVWSRGQGPPHVDAVRITFVEIGQGDAAVIELPDGNVWLVDGGGLPFVAPTAKGDPQKLAETPARLALLPYLRHRRITHIDLAIVSHAHPDHFVGLQAVARRMPIRELWSVHQRSAQPGPYETWLAGLRDAGTIVRAPEVGMARTSSGAGLEVLWPLYSETGTQLGRASMADPILTVNDNSLVIRLVVGQRNVLFAGDIEAEAEQLLVDHYGDGLGADILKVPHHGSRTSSTPAFVRATRPAVAVISCGRANRFDFPATEVEERWSASGSQVLRTDKVGSVTVEIERSGRMRVRTVDPF